MAANINIRRLLSVVITIILLLAYLIALSGWFFSASQFFLGALFNVAFAFLWPAVFVLAVIWWFFDKKWAIVLAGFLLSGISPAKATFSIGIQIPFSAKKLPNSLRVMQWNCMDLHVNGLWSDKQMKDREVVKTFFNKYRPDIICLQDFAEIEGKQFLSNIQFLRDTLGFRYIHTYYRAQLIFPYGKVKMGNLIASRVPFTALGYMEYEAPQFSNPVLWADLIWQGKPVRIVTTHFQSMNLFSHNEFNPNTLPYYSKPDSAIIMSPDILFKIQYFQKIHAKQAKQVSQFLDTTRIPVIFAADLNSVPASYIYKKIKGKRFKDGFVGSKTGLGNTFNYLLPNLRIDYLLHDTAFKTAQWHHFSDGFFDHDHLMGDYYRQE